MELKDILAKCDHTLLRVDATAEEIRNLCDEGMKYGCASVCIPAAHVAGAKRYVGDRLAICTVIGFPNGYSTSAVKAYEAADAVKNGAEHEVKTVRMSFHESSEGSVYFLEYRVRAEQAAFYFYERRCKVCLYF